jgi:hypothetical protein
LSEGAFDVRSENKCVTVVEISDHFANDGPFFKSLVETTGENFVSQEVSVDKAYSSRVNLQTVVDHNCDALHFHSRAIPVRKESLPQ